MFIVTASPILSASPYGAGLHQALEIHAARLSSDRVFTIQPGGLTAGSRWSVRAKGPTTGQSLT